MPPAPWPGGRAGWAQDCPSQSFATVVPSPWHSRFLPEANSIRQSYVSYAGNRECFFCLLSIPLTKVSGSQPDYGGEGDATRAAARLIKHCACCALDHTPAGVAPTGLPA